MQHGDDAKNVFVWLEKPVHILNRKFNLRSICSVWVYSLAALEVISTRAADARRIQLCFCPADASTDLYTCLCFRMCLPHLLCQRERRARAEVPAREAYPSRGEYRVTQCTLSTDPNEFGDRLHRLPRFDVYLSHERFVDKVSPTQLSPTIHVTEYGTYPDIISCCYPMLHVYATICISYIHIPTIYLPTLYIWSVKFAVRFNLFQLKCMHNAERWKFVIMKKNGNTQFVYVHHKRLLKDVSRAGLYYCPTGREWETKRPKNSSYSW